ncbi:MAG: hypothetical protein IKK47_01635 [Ruminococcus sp.]|nr:hypothetical protein [Ruminococcus sp.]
MISIISGIILPAIFHSIFCMICRRKKVPEIAAEKKLSKDEKKQLRKEEREKRKKSEKILLMIMITEIVLFIILNLISMYAMNFNGLYISPVAVAVSGILPFAAVTVRYFKGDGKLFIFLKRISVAAIVLISAEVVLFNGKSFDKEKNKNIIPANMIQMSDGAVVENDRIVVNASSSLTLNYVPDGTNALIIDFDRKIDENSNTISVGLFLKDENLSRSFELIQNKITMACDRDTTLSFQPYGKVKALRLDIGEVHSPVTINSITAVSAIPFHFSMIRFLILLGVCAAVFAVLSFELWRVSYQSRKPLHILITELMAIVCTLSVFIMTDPFKKPEEYDSENAGNLNPYNQTLDAFLKKQVSLDIDVQPELETLDNVYDTSERNEKEIHGRWDYAYYKGKYYCYFGCAPVLTYNLPYYLITGKLPSTDMTLGFFSVLAAYFLCRMLLAAVRLFAPKANLLIILSFMAVTPGLSGLYYCVNVGSTYNIPIACGLCWLFLCLWTGFEACLTSKKPLKLVLLSVSGISLAFCTASRPGIALCSVILIPLFIGILRNKEQKPVFRGAQAVCFCVPLLIGGILLMMYNNARFGSPFDFGYKYQLTVSNVSANSLSFAGLPPMLYHYFFQLPRAAAVFPFFEPTYCILYNYQKYTFLADCIGVFTYPVIAAGFLMIPSALKKNRFSNNCGVTAIQQKSVIILCFAMALFIAWQDFCLGGAVTRYVIDFMPLLMIGVLLCILRGSSNPEKHTMRYGLIIASCAATFVISCLLTIQVKDGSLMRRFPNLYDTVEDLMIFWQ